MTLRHLHNKKLLLALRALSVLPAADLSGCDVIHPSPADPTPAVSAPEQPAIPFKAGVIVLTGYLTAHTARQINVGGIWIRIDDRIEVPSKLVIGDLIQVQALLLPGDICYALSVYSLRVNSRVAKDTFRFSGMADSLEPKDLIESDCLSITCPERSERTHFPGYEVEIEGYLSDGSLVITKVQWEDDGEKELADVDGVAETSTLDDPISFDELRRKGIHRHQGCGAGHVSGKGSNDRRGPGKGSSRGEHRDDD